MAIGLGRMFGFTIAENFNFPYISKSIQEFWQRWHISLSAWLRDYLFSPLSLKLRNSGNFGIALLSINHFFTLRIMAWSGMDIYNLGIDTWSFFLTIERIGFGKQLEKIGNLSGIYMLS